MPLVVDRVEARAHGLQIASPGGGFRLLADRRELRRAEGPAVALQRVRGAHGRGGVAGGRRFTQRLELGRSVLEELVDELGEELRIVAHALAQLAEYGSIDCASKFRHLRTRPEPNVSPLAFPSAGAEVDPVAP